MTTPGGGGGPKRPAVFGSPMGTGNMAKRASAAAAADLANLASAAAKYRKDMEAAAKAAEKATAEVKKQADVIKQLSRLDTEAIYAKQGWTGMPTRSRGTGNGGNAAMPPLPGAVGARANQIAGLGDVDRAGVIPSGNVNGGGARIPGLGGIARGTAGAMFGGFMADVVDPDTWRQRDFLANRASRISGGAYNKTAGARMVTQLGMNSFRSVEEQMAFFRPVLTDNRTGFTTSSAQMGRMARGAQATAALNPLAGGSAFQTEINLGAPQMFNTLRMMTGIETVGRGGAPRSTAEIARELVASTTQGRYGTGVGNKAMSQRGVAAALGERGGLRLQMNAAGMDQDMQSAIARYLEESAIGGRYLSESAINQRRTPGSRTMYGTDQRNATAKQALTAEALESYSKGYEAASKLVREGMDALRVTLENLPTEIKDAIIGPLGGAGALGTFGKAGTAGVAGLGAMAGAVGGVAGTALLGRGARALRNVNSAPPGSPRGWGARLGRVAKASPAGVGVGLLGSIIDDGEGGARDRVGSALAWGATGATLGMFGGPVGAAVGGGLGALGGLMFGDGPGEAPRPKFGTAAFPGVAGAEMGDSDKGAGGRGKGTIQYLRELMARSGLPHRITSAKRSGGGRSYHDTGHAVDIAGPTPGVNTKEMLAINRYLATKLGRGAKELIYSGPGGINLYNGNPHVYSASVRKNHHDHVHVAVTEASLKRKGEALTGMDEEAAVQGEKAVARRQRAMRKSTSVGRGRSIALGRQGRSGTGFSERKLIEDFFSGIGEGLGFTSRPAVADDPLEGTGTSGSTGNAGSSVGAHAIDKFLFGLRMHESRNNYEADNPNSTAAGAYQYLTGTWNNYRGYKTADQAPPHIQDERARQDASRLYTKYGNWRMVAAAHFQGEGWLRRNPDPSKWDAAGNRSGGNPLVSKYVSSVLSQGGLPETGDGPGSAGSVTADVPRPQQYRQGGGGGNMQVDARRGGSIHIAKVEVKLTTPQVSEAEAQRIGKMVVEQIARAARMSEMSS